MLTDLDSARRLATQKVNEATELFAAKHHVPLAGLALAMTKAGVKNPQHLVVGGHYNPKARLPRRRTSVTTFVYAF